MNFEIYDIVYILSGFLMTYTIYKFMRIFYAEKNVNLKIEIASYVLYFIITTILHLFVKLPAVLIASNIGLFIMLSFNYKSSLKKKILTSLLIYSILMSIEMIVVIGTGYVELGPLTKSNYQSILGIIIIRMISYFVALLIGSYKNIRREYFIPNAYWLCISIIPLGTLYLLITIFMDSNLTVASVFRSTVLVLLINFAIFYMYDEIAKILLDKTDKIMIQQQNKYYENQLELMKRWIVNTNLDGFFKVM